MSPTSDLSGIFKAYDVRGVYPDDLNEDIARRVGAGFAEFSGAPSIVVGRDMRLSSPALAAAFIEGARGRGVDVVDIGEVSSDALYYASGVLDAPGAMFTASHNPARYNGIKMCKAGAAPVGQDTGLAEVREGAEADLPAGNGAGALTTKDVVEDFARHVTSFVDAGRLRPLTVAVDAGNGMAGKMIPPLFAHLPVRLVPLYFELDGSFPNHPADPIQAANLKDLQAAVLREGADLGLAFDGDADRVFLVDEKAELVSGSLTTALVATRVLARNPGASIVHNLICSRIVPETIAAHGGTPIRSRVGHSFIKQVMAESGAAFGGEHSGHYYFRDNFRADSGMICSMFVLEALSAGDQPLSEVLAPYRKYWDSGERNTEVADPVAKMKELEQAHADGTVDWMDGLTVNYHDWWFNARPSNTEPLLRLNVEASSAEDGEARTAELLARISA
ncbi:MAG TPA: phosphomannomutase/phosphoglucomutase [Actinomycetota bacterium]|nr:phosphomannomutase/phosphoglucomutase [Actinomycetota bacterium]